MRYLILATLVLLKFNFLLSQTVTAHSHLQEQTFEIDLPDSLFVVYGDRMKSTDNIFIDRDETLIQYDILLLYHPGTCDILRPNGDTYESIQRINLESAIEIFFGDNFTQNFDLKDDEEIFTVTQHQVFSKFKPIEILNIKSTKLIFLDVEGNIISSKEYYDKKFLIQKLIKIIFKS